MLILGNRFSGKRTLLYYFQNYNLFNNYNCLFDGSKWDINIIDIENNINDKSQKHNSILENKLIIYKHLSSFKQKIILITINSTNYKTEINNIQNILHICNSYKYPIIFVLTKLDLLLWDNNIIEQINNYIISFLYNFTIIYKVIPISINKVNKISYNIIDKQYNINLFESIDYIKFYSFIPLNIRNVFKLKIENKDNIMSFNKCISNIFIYDINIIQDDISVYCIIKNYIDIDINNPIMLLDNNYNFLFVKILDIID
jgi:hypothetical protein